MLAGMLPACLLRQQERGPAPPVGGKTVVLSHQHTSHTHMWLVTSRRRWHQPHRSHHHVGWDTAWDLCSTALAAVVPMQRRPHCAWHGKAFCHLPPAFNPLAVLKALLPAGGKDLAQVLTTSPQPQGLLHAQSAQFCWRKGAAATGSIAKPRELPSLLQLGVTSTWAAPPNSPKSGEQLGKAAWRGDGSLPRSRQEQQQRRTGQARQENPEFSPLRCFACLTASRALPVGLWPLPALGAFHLARSPGRKQRCLVNPVGSTPSQGGVPVQVWVPPTHPKSSESQHGTGHVPAKSPQSCFTGILFSP